MVSASSSDLHDALRRYFGFPAFRERQEEIVRRAVAGKDTLALMPTGAGKSLCYQLAAMLRPEPTLVLSPLIALMKDQVDNLPPAIAQRASFINSSLEAMEAAQRVSALANGEYRLLYAAPERLRQRRFVDALRAAGVGLVVIDEAHCVSMWGHDFRPDYLFIRTALETLGAPPVLGLTATAAPATAEDIRRSLGRPMDVIRTTVRRPNLRYEVQRVANEEERLRAVVERAKGLPGAGIVYARSRERCETVAAIFRRNGVRAAHYHAGMDAEERTRVQDGFLRADTRVIVATTAFGMGIDKPDIRWIVLYNYPDSLESYVQMVGRAGRDGEQSVCVLFAGAADASNLRRFARSGLPSVETLRAVYRTLASTTCGGWTEIPPEELARLASLREEDDPRVLVGMLERVELLRRDFDAGRAMRFQLMPAPPDTPRRIENLLHQYEQAALARADRIVRFADAHRCRHRQVAEHFGETISVPCGMCDVCAPQHQSRPAAPEERKALPGNIGETILDAVDSLYRPLGVRGLAATLKGSIEAPPTGQRSDVFGALSSAPLATIKRWINQLVESDHLEQFESDDGYRFLRRGKRCDAPVLSANRPGADSAVSLTPEDMAFFERLREWRMQRAQEAGVPAYIILTDAVLRQIAASRPRSRTELAGLYGMGPTKTNQYGDEILALVQVAERPPDESAPSRHTRTAEDRGKAGEPPPGHPEGGPTESRAGAPQLNGAGRAMDVTNGHLAGRLQAWRQEQARRSGLSTTMILPDGSLAAIARARPTTRAALALCADLGPDRFDRYADEILALVRAADA